MRVRVLKPVLNLITAFSCALVIATCSGLLNPSQPDMIGFEGFSSGTATPSSPYSVTGTITTDNGLDSIRIEVWGPDGAPAATKGIAGNGTSSYNLTYSVSVGASDCNGAYSVDVTAFSAGSSETKTVTVTVSGAKNCSQPGTPSLVVGALTGPSALTPSSPVTLTSQVTCTNCTGLSVQTSVKVSDSSGMNITDGSVTATTSGSVTVEVRVSATTAACNGSYKVTLTVTAGTLSQSKTATVIVSGAKSCGMSTGDLTVHTGIKLGAQSNTAGSSFDIDSFAVLTVANAKASAENVDIIAGHSAALDSIKLGSPKWALDNALTVAEGWDLYNTTQFKKPPSSIDMATVTETALKTAWNSVSIYVSSVSCAVGNQYLTVTSEGAIAVVEVTAVTNGISGSVTLNVGKTRAGVITPPVPEAPVDSNLTVGSTLSVGANENSVLGSSIDLDQPAVYKSADAKTNAALVDLVYSNSFATSSDKLGSPLWAKDNVLFVTGWSVYNATKFYKLTGTTFESITTANQLQALWQDSKATASSIDVVANDIVIAKTDKAVIVLIKIVSQTPGSAGKIDIKIAK